MLNAFRSAGLVWARSFGKHSLRCGYGSACRAQPDVEVEFICGGCTRILRLRRRLCCRHLSVLLDEYPCATQAAKRRLVRRKRLSENDVGFLNLDRSAHIQTEIKQPITGLRAATQQPDKGGDTGWRLGRAAFQTSQDWFFLRRFRSIALLIVGHENLL